MFDLELLGTIDVLGKCTRPPMVDADIERMIEYAWLLYDDGDDGGGGCDSDCVVHCDRFHNIRPMKTTIETIETCCWSGTTIHRLLSNWTLDCLV